MNKAIQEFFDNDYAFPVGSGTVGLYAILKAANIAGHKVIVPIITCPNVVIAVYAAGGIPVIVDVSEDNMNISIDSVAKAMDSSTRAIIAVDSFGYPADIHGIKEVCKQHECLVIEDACQAYGGEIDGKVIGGRADIGVISFGYSKPISLNGGGYIITNSTELSEKLNNVLRYPLSFIHALKNRIALEFMFKRKHELFIFLARYSGLLKYGFPIKMQRKLSEIWTNFNSRILENKTNLMKVHKSLMQFKGIKVFNYVQNGWLPWRYSFLVMNPTDRLLFTEMAHEEGISVSRLYPPLTSQFNDIEVSCETNEAHSIFSGIINLVYDLEGKSTEMLFEKVERLRMRWDSRLRKE